MQTDKIINIDINTQLLESLLLNRIKDEFVETNIQKPMFYTVQDLVLLTGLSEGSIYKYLIENNEFPKYKLGRKWLFRKDETDEFLDNWIQQFKYEY